MCHTSLRFFHFSSIFLLFLMLHNHCYSGLKFKKSVSDILNLLSVTSGEFLLCFSTLKFMFDYLIVSISLMRYSFCSLLVHYLIILCFEHIYKRCFEVFVCLIQHHTQMFRVIPVGPLIVCEKSIFLCTVKNYWKTGPCEQ